jgi:uncharacterized protein (DUF924 family)
VDEILHFWFGDLDETGEPLPEQKKRWWTKDPHFDDEIRDRFSTIFSELLNQDRPNWTEEPRGLLAAIIVLDQFSRNMFRDSPRMYSGDAIALRLAYEFIALGFDGQFSATFCTFAYMPLMHSERLIDQERCVELFRKLTETANEDEREALLYNLDFAIRHRDIVAQFGRFPHRNEILARESSPQEIEFLKNPGSSF